MTSCHLFQVALKKIKHVEEPEVSLRECGDNGVLTAEPIQFKLPLNCPDRCFVCVRPEAVSLCVRYKLVVIALG